MRKIAAILLPSLALVFMVTFNTQAAKYEHGFTGSSKCRICHMSDKKGDQFGKWQESLHSKAYETLGTAEAKAVEGAGDNPQENPECLRCHLTGYDAPAELLGAKYDKAEGVGCESCHGPGEDYSPMKVMRDREASIAAGLVIPDAELCKSCHNEESPTFKGFECKEFWAKIAHDNPNTEGGGTLKGCN